MGTFLQDLRFSMRSLRRAPAFPLAAIATLALGIGATTAIFTTLNAVLLKPLPDPDPERLYSIRSALTDGRVTTGLMAYTEILPLNDPALSEQVVKALQGFIDAKGTITVRARPVNPVPLGSLSEAVGKAPETLPSLLSVEISKSP